jgi:hypothetical protein
MCEPYHAPNEWVNEGELREGAEQDRNLHDVVQRSEAV